ncbi:SET domain-containing protein, partial [Calocera cornea HHB12733]
YVFDLDAEEKREDLSLAGKFSVDAENCGNWTRFINNSCDPNLIVRTVNYEAPAKQHPGRLIFICDRDIEAGEELTFTYTPTHAVAPEDIALKPRCSCDAENCRGWY